jgi:hypothetical protein
VDPSTRALNLHKRIRCGQGEILTLEWNPESTHIAALTDRMEAGVSNSFIWLCAVEGCCTQEIKLPGGGQVAALAWSADSTHIFSCGHDQNVVRLHAPCFLFHAPLLVRCLRTCLRRPPLHRRAHPVASPHIARANKRLMVLPGTPVRVARWTLLVPTVPCGLGAMPCAAAK